MLIHFRGPEGREGSKEKDRNKGRGGALSPPLLSGFSLHPRRRARGRGGVGLRIGSRPGGACRRAPLPKTTTIHPLPSWVPLQKSACCHMSMRALLSRILTCLFVEPLRAQVVHGPPRILTSCSNNSIAEMLDVIMHAVVPRIWHTWAQASLLESTFSLTVPTPPHLLRTVLDCSGVVTVRILFGGSLLGTLGSSV